MKSNLVSFLIISISFIILEFGVCVGYASAGNDLITGYLRVDQGVVANSDDYTTYLLSTQIPSTAYGFTTNWLGITGVDSTTFAQVGLIGWNDGLRWFVFTYSPSGVDCLRGSGYWGQNPNGKYKGCRGSVGDLVSMNNWYKVELVSYGQGFWIARVYDTYSIAHDVAKIWINVSTIYKAYNAVEEGYSTISDPQLEGSFYQYSPQYMIWGSGFADWPQSTLPRSANPPESGGNYSRIIADSVFCPSYFSASVNVFGLERAWYGGNSGDGICDWVLFPPISYSGNYDDSSTSLIDYKYAWTHTGQTPSFHRAYNGTESWTNTLGGSATFTFNGSSISRIYSPCPNRGNLLIYIDGVLQQDTPPDNIYGPPSGRWQVIRTWAVSPGEDHTIQVVNNGGGYTDADGFAVNLFAVGNGNYDDFDYGHITYFNSSSSIWTHSTPWPLAYAQTESWDKTQSDGFRFTFSGNSVTYWYSKARNRGWVGVIIDGEDKGIIDPYNYSSIFQVPKQYSELGSGTHTIEITVMGPPWKNEDSSDYYIDLDRFSVP